MNEINVMLPLNKTTGHKLSPDWQLTLIHSEETGFHFVLWVIDLTHKSKMSHFKDSYAATVEELQASINRNLAHEGIKVRLLTTF